MPAGFLRKIPRSKPSSTRGGLTRKQKTQVKKLAKQQIMKTTEAKHSHYNLENIQLYHNQPAYVTGLYATSQGLDDDDVSSGSAGVDLRVGDECYINNINMRLWLSNKNDRPNVMYRIILFEYNQGESVTNALTFFTQTNKMLDRVNNEKVNVLMTKYLKPGNDFTLNGHEHSKLIALNHKFKKPKKIQYENGGSSPKDKNLALCVVCYDAYGTLQTDNIASYAYDIKLTFRDP